MVKRVSKTQEPEAAATILVYGLDRLEYKTPRERLKIGNMELEFVDFADTSRVLDSAAGIIVPQGIFEKIEFDPDPHAIVRDDQVKVFAELLAAREKQALNLIADAKWIAFLVGRVIDRVSWDLGGVDASATDLCKRVLNHFGIRREPMTDRADVVCRQSEFQRYLRTYGVARTKFLGALEACDDAVVLASAGESVVGFELSRQCFFLPFHSAARASGDAQALAETIATAVIAYRSKQLVLIPQWLDDFVFEGEKRLEEQLAALRGETDCAVQKLGVWRRYKAILVTSGDLLRDLVGEVLEDFFGLRVDLTERCREDGLVLDGSGSALVSFETKGVSGGIKRDHVNQVDSNRERSELPPTVPGLLLVNDAMQMQGLSARLGTSVHPEIIAHAARANVTIARTVDLLFMMRLLEQSDKRGEQLLSCLAEGGGWLKANESGFKVVK